MKRRLPLCLGILCLLIAFLLMFMLNLPTQNERVIRFSSHYGDKPVTLEASFWPADGAEYAALICPTAFPS